MSTPDHYTPNPPATASERLGATENNDWTPVRVPGSDQGTADDSQPDDTTETAPGEDGDDVEDELSAYNQTTGG
jgi:hypothetical protein